MSDVQFTITFTYDCCPRCGTWFGIPTSVRRLAKDGQPRTLWCPFGHEYLSSPPIAPPPGPPVESSTAELKRLRKRVAQLLHDREQGEASTVNQNT